MTKEFKRGHGCAKEAIAKGEDALELLNQARGSLTYDEFDRGWRQACEEQINIQNEISNTQN